jgi:hypothetical protein
VIESNSVQPPTTDSLNIVFNFIPRTVENLQSVPSLQVSKPEFCGIDPLLGNAGNTHAAINTGAVLSVVSAATIAMQRAIHRSCVFCAAWSDLSLYNEILFVARRIRELELGVRKL